MSNPGFLWIEQRKTVNPCTGMIPAPQALFFSTRMLSTGIS